MSPVDSAIASGATSGVTTKAPSVVADDDLEKFEEDQFSNPQSAGGFSYQGYPEQQPGSEYHVCVYHVCVCTMLSVLVCMMLCRHPVLPWCFVTISWEIMLYMAACVYCMTGCVRLLVCDGRVFA